LNQDRIEQLLRSGNLADAVQATLSLPPESLESTLTQLAKNLQPDSIPFLQSLDKPDKPQAVVKSARRALHRLRSQGVEIPEVIPPPADMGLMAGRRILRSLLSPVDGSGTQALLVLLSAPMTGLEGVDLLVSDLEGIYDMHAVRLAKKEYDERITAMREDFTLIDAPVDYVLFRAREYEEINRRENRPLPSDYHIYRELFHMPGREYDRPIVYDEMESVDPSDAKRAKELFEVRDLATWFIEDEIQPFASRIIEADESPIVLMEAAKEERFERILRDAAETIFTPEVKARDKRRLEENAYVLLHTDQAGLPRPVGDLAKVALACAAELAPDGPPTHQAAFVKEIVQYSLYVAFSQQKRESPIHRIGT